MIVDDFLRNYPDEYIPGLNDKISLSVLAYEDALKWWKLKFNTYNNEVEDFVYTSDDRLKYFFQNYSNMKGDMNKHKVKTKDFYIDQKSGDVKEKQVLKYYIDGGFDLLWMYADEYTEEGLLLLNEATKK